MSIGCLVACLLACLLCHCYAGKSVMMCVWFDFQIVQTSSFYSVWSEKKREWGQDGVGIVIDFKASVAVHA
jgi:hypothetical protein